MRVRVWALWRQPGNRLLEAEPGRQMQAFWRQETLEKQMQDVGILGAWHGRSGGRCRHTHLGGRTQADAGLSYFLAVPYTIYNKYVLYMTYPSSCNADD